MVKYRIAYSLLVEGLEMEVQKLLKEGWELQGGVSKSKTGFAQALILKPIKLL